MNLGQLLEGQEAVAAYNKGIQLMMANQFADQAQVCLLFKSSSSTAVFKITHYLLKEAKEKKNDPKNSSLILQIIFDELSMVNNKRFSGSGQGVPTKCDKVVGVQYCCLVQN